MDTHKPCPYCEKLVLESEFWQCHTCGEFGCSGCVPYLCPECEEYYELEDWNEKTESSCDLFAEMEEEELL